MSKISIISNYRADIDGLRALAVIVVVGYHAFPSHMSGGFIGVDIFFVISGFLISRIIFSDIDNFSFLEFYVRRIKRIFPALLLVLLFSLLLGWFVLFADEYSQLGKHIAGGAGFLSNFIILKDIGYFDTSSDVKPLLHLWSLGIEEQFYIIWPFLLWFASRKGLNLMAICLFIICISFVMNIYIIKIDAVTAFYSPISRFWELIGGGLLAYLTLYKSNILKSNYFPLSCIDSFVITGACRKLIEYKTFLCNASSGFGFILITIATFTISENDQYPGWLALLPVLGAYMILSAGPKVWFNRYVLSNRPLVYIGLISYPLYLWHWPLLSFARIIEGETPSEGISAIAILVSLLLAWITYYFVEKPIRFRNHGGIKAVLLSMLMIIIGSAGYSVFKWNELNEIMPLNKRSYAFSESTKRSDRLNECFDVNITGDDWLCHLNKSKHSAKIIVYGDSHAFSLLPVFEKIASDRDIDILFTSRSGCLPFIGIYSIRGVKERGVCFDLNKKVFDYAVSNNITDVFAIARWTYYTIGEYADTRINFVSKSIDGPHTMRSSREAFEYGLDLTVLKYSQASINLHLVKDVPTQLHHIKDLQRKILAKRIITQESIDSFSVSLKQHSELQKYVTSLFELKRDNPYVNVVNLDPIYCDNIICPFGSVSKLFYYDADHLSVSGAMKSEVLFKQFF